MMRKFIQVALVSTLILAIPAGTALADEGGEVEQPSEDPPIAVASAPARFSLADLEPGYYEETPLPREGWMMYYNPGVMEQVLDFRRQARHVTECPECIGYVAMLRAGDLDRRIWIEREGRPLEGPFWVIDVAAPQHVGQLLDRGWIVDVDYETAMRWRMGRPHWVRIWSEPPPDPFLLSQILAGQQGARSMPRNSRHWAAVTD